MICYSFELPPPHSNSHHHDSYIFRLLWSQTKPSFATIASWGPGVDPSGKYAGNFQVPAYHEDFLRGVLPGKPGSQFLKESKFGIFYDPGTGNYLTFTIYSTIVFRVLPSLKLT